MRRTDFEASSRPNPLLLSRPTEALGACVLRRLTRAECAATGSVASRTTQEVPPCQLGVRCHNESPSALRATPPALRIRHGHFGGTSSGLVRYRFRHSTTRGTESQNTTQGPEIRQTRCVEFPRYLHLFVRRPGREDVPNQQPVIGGVCGSSGR